MTSSCWFSQNEKVLYHPGSQNHNITILTMKYFIWERIVFTFFFIIIISFALKTPYDGIMALCIWIQIIQFKDYESTGMYMNRPFGIYVTFPSLFVFSIILFHFKQLSKLRHCRQVISFSLPIALGTCLSIGM